jgi:formylglycine-generating enzyme required for sulfatase activity
MKTLMIPIVLAGGFFAAQVTSAPAQDTRFFRLVGPAVTTITGISQDGYVTWNNAATDVTCTVETALALVGPSNWVDYVQVPISNAVTTVRLFDPNPPSGMALIPAGSFTMGATTNMGHESYSEEVPQHSVYVSAFYMDRYEVTKALWNNVKAWNGGNGYSYSYGGSGKAANHPVHTIYWYDMVKWCNARSQQEGLVPCYYTDAGLTVIYQTGQVAPYVKWNANGYRLPTEAEWEKAARGGASGKRFPWSDANTINHSRANYSVYQYYGTNDFTYDVSPTSGRHPTFATGDYPYTSPVGYFAANGYGLYDMAGNVWEWCWDWHQSDWYSQAGATQNDTRGPTGPLSYRVLRGGAWVSGADFARCASRVNSTPSSTYDVDGFRCVRGL